MTDRKPGMDPHIWPLIFVCLVGWGLLIWWLWPW